jgi:hypothetical protein
MHRASDRLVLNDGGTFEGESDSESLSDVHDSDPVLQ